MKKEKTFYFAGKLVVAANILTIEVYKRSQTFIIQIEALNGKKFTEEIFDKEYSDAAIICTMGKLFNEMSDSEYKEAQQKANLLEDKVKDRVRARIEEIKKML